MRELSNKNLAIASRSRVSCAHNTSKALRHLKLAVDRFKCANAYYIESSSNSFNDVTWNNFRFRLLVTCHLRIVVMHLLIKLGADTFIQSGVIDIFPIFKMAAAAILDFQIMLIWLFRRVDSVVYVLGTKFGSNICYSHWDRRTYATDVHLMTPRELTYSFDIWSHGHLRMTMMHRHIKFGAYIFIQSGVRHFSVIQDGGRRHLGFSVYVNLAILACW